MHRLFVLLCVIVLAGASGHGENLPPPSPRQAVLDTAFGSIVMDLYPDAAPTHTARFLERIEKNLYVGTVFHRAVAMGIIQGGDPLSRDPEKKAQYGTGGLNEMKRESNSISHLRGTVSAVLIPERPDSAGSQFFICVTDQKQLDGQFTAFARVVEGMEAVEKISLLPSDSEGRIEQRVEIRKTHLRDRPKPEPIPFMDTPVDELSRFKVLITTPLGNIDIKFLPEAAPRHVRQFLRFAQLGLYDGTTFHRVVPGFVVQGGSMSSRRETVPEKYSSLLKALTAEFNSTRHVRGAVSMARGADPNSGLDSFFIVLGPQPQLDGKYTVFGQVVAGMETADAISSVPLNGETPVRPIGIEMRVIRAGVEK